MSAAKKMMDEKAEMDMTPMIDIVFNLLIFFMVVTDLTQKELAALTLPIAHMAAEDKDDDLDERVILNVDKVGRILYKGKAISLDELGTILRQRKDAYELKMRRKGQSGLEDIGNGAKASKLYVLLRADKETPWQHVQWLMTIMAEQKLYKMQFATRRFIGGTGPGGYEPGEQEMLGGLTQRQYNERVGKGG